MDLTTIAQKLHENMTPMTVALFILLIASEVLGSVESIKVSSIFRLLQAMLMTVKDQVWPQSK